MAIDIFCLCFGALYAVFGYFFGGLRQLVKLAAMVAAYFGAVWSSPILSDVLTRSFGVKTVFLDFIALAIAWLVLYLVFSFIGKMFTKTLTGASETISSLDKWFGLFLGLLKAALIIILVVLALSTVKEHIYRQKPEAIKVFESSYVIRFMTRTRLADYILPDDAKKILDMAADGVKLGEVDPSAFGGDPLAEEVYTKPVFRDFIKDQELMDKVREGQVLEVMADPKFKKLMQDPEVRRLISKLGATVPETK